MTKLEEEIKILETDNNHSVVNNLNKVLRQHNRSDADYKQADALVFFRAMLPATFVLSVKLTGTKAEVVKFDKIFDEFKKKCGLRGDVLIHTGRLQLEYLLTTHLWPRFQVTITDKVATPPYHDGYRNFADEENAGDGIDEKPLPPQTSV